MDMHTTLEYAYSTLCILPITVVLDSSNPTSYIYPTRLYVCIAMHRNSYCTSSYLVHHFDVFLKKTVLR